MERNAIDPLIKEWAIYLKQTEEQTRKLKEEGYDRWCLAAPSSDDNSQYHGYRDSVSHSDVNL